MLRVLERVLLAGGIVALSVFAVEHWLPQIQAAQTIARFEAAQTVALIEDSRSDTASAPDMSLWSAERIAAYQGRDAQVGRGAVGVIRIDSVAIEAPIFAGASDRVLDVGVGWIPGTARLGQPGNVGLAAHRDGFFRSLKDIEEGDSIRVSSAGVDKVYHVRRTEIVAPEDVHVLAPSEQDRLTLVTCHPFYFVGSAPNRFIVHAVAAN